MLHVGKEKGTARGCVLGDDHGLESEASRNLCKVSAGGRFEWLTCLPDVDRGGAHPPSTAFQRDVIPPKTKGGQNQVTLCLICGLYCVVTVYDVPAVGRKRRAKPDRCNATVLPL